MKNRLSVLAEVRSIRDVLPVLTVIATGAPRYIPEFEWSSKSWVHNVFRVYETIFGRRYGIRPEVTAYEHNGRSYQFAHTWEATFALIEWRIREALSWRPAPFRIYVPILATPQGIQLPQHPFLFAIAVDTTASGTYGSDPRTWSHTCTGSDLCLFMATFSFGSGSTFTYNSTALTVLGGYQYASTVRYGKLAYLLSPSTGSNTASMTTSGSGVGVTVSYTGVKQTGQPDAAINTQTTGTGTGTSLTATVTVTASGSWLMMGTICEGAALTAGTGATLRITGSNPAVAFFDSNGAPGTGSQSMSVSESPANGFAIGMVSMAPAASAAAAIYGLSLMGCGT